MSLLMSIKIGPGYTEETNELNKRQIQEISERVRGCLKYIHDARVPLPVTITIKECGVDDGPG